MLVLFGYVCTISVACATIKTNWVARFYVHTTDYICYKYILVYSGLASAMSRGMCIHSIRQRHIT